MTITPFASIDACVFDAYGTLFDVHSAVNRHRNRFSGNADAVSGLWRAKQLEYTWLRSLMGKHADFWQVTQEALDFTFETFTLKDDELRNDLLQAYRQLDCYPEVPKVLKRLKDRGVRTAILSNGSLDMLEAALDSTRLMDLIDKVLSIETVGVYKPDPRVYQLAVDQLSFSPQKISFQSSNGWDIAGAASFGLSTVWINRFGQQRERLPHGPAAELATLAELPALLNL